MLSIFKHRLWNFAKDLFFVIKSNCSYLQQDFVFMKREKRTLLTEGSTLSLSFQCIVRHVSSFCSKVPVDLTP